MNEAWLLEEAFEEPRVYCPTCDEECYINKWGDAVCEPCEEIFSPPEPDYDLDLDDYERYVSER